jgi:glycosyltransferase involved in cell wall biosynthesis
MIDVLYYLNNLSIGGTERTAELFAKYLDRDKFRAYVAYKKDGDNCRFQNFVKAADQLFPISRMSDLQRIIDVNTIDILHVFRSGGPEVPEPNLHVNVDHFVQTNVFGGMNTDSNIDADLFMSEWLLNASPHRMYTPNRLLDFVNNPVELPITLNKIELDIDPTTTIIGRAGRPDDGVYDNISVLAVKKLIDEGYSIHFLVLAPPPAMEEDLKRLNIPCTFLEPTTNPDGISQFYNTIDIYCEARSDGHTFGNSYVDAMMHGKPVVVHKAVPKHLGMGVFQAQVDIVTRSCGGFAVEYDVNEYAKKIKCLIDDFDTYKIASESAQSWVEANAEASVSTKKLEKIYETIYRNSN